MVVAYKESKAKSATQSRTIEKNHSFGHSVRQNGIIADNERPDYNKNIGSDSGLDAGIAEKAGPGEGDWLYDSGQADASGEAGPKENLTSKCGGRAILSECLSGLHHFAKRLLCGKEWCDTCGEDGSASHKRRMARLLPKLQQVSQLGYLVIEFPNEVRYIGQGGIKPDLDQGESIAGWCYSKDDLRETTNTIINTLAGKRCGRRGRIGGYFDRGLARWHWFGETCLFEQRVSEKFVRCELTGKQCVLKSNKKKRKKTCNDFLNDGKWNPHLNILVDFNSLAAGMREAVEPAIEERKVELRSGKETKAVRKELNAIDMYQEGKSGYMPRPLLEKVQGDLRAALNVPDLIVHYSYADKPGQICHKAKYAARATFRDWRWNEYMANEIWNFRNQRWWGDWKQEPVWTLDKAQEEGEDIEGLQAVEALHEGKCPDCGQPLRTLRYSPEFSYRHIKTEDGPIDKPVQNPNAGKPICWSKPVDDVWLKIWGAQEIAGSGYFRIPHIDDGGRSIAPLEVYSALKGSADPDCQSKCWINRNGGKCAWEEKEKVIEGVVKCQLLGGPCILRPASE